jgi:hypothetical protein
VRDLQHQPTKVSADLGYILANSALLPSLANMQIWRNQERIGLVAAKKKMFGSIDLPLSEQLLGWGSRGRGR